MNSFDYSKLELSLSVNDIRKTDHYDAPLDNPYSIEQTASLWSSSMMAKRNLSFTGVVLAIISTIIGGGIVGLPYSFYYAGIPVAILLNLIVTLLTILSCYMYLLAKDLTNGR
jgi:hypothetical protein